MKMLNNINLYPSNDPRGTPLVTGLRLLLMSNLQCHQFRQFLIHLTMFLSSLYFICLAMTMLLEMVSKTLLK